MKREVKRISFDDVVDLIDLRFFSMFFDTAEKNHIHVELLNYFLIGFLAVISIL